MENHENMLLFSTFIVLPIIIVILLSIKTTIENKADYDRNGSSIKMFMIFTIGGLTNSTLLLINYVYPDIEDSEQKEFIHYIMGLVYVLLEDLP